jgi:hypothetical protein
MWEMEELGRGLGSGASGKQSKAKHAIVNAKHVTRALHDCLITCVQVMYTGEWKGHTSSPGGACEMEDKDEVFVLQLVFDKHKCDPVSKTCLSLRAQRLLLFATPSQFLFLDTESGQTWRLGFYYGSFYFLTPWTDAGATDEI